MADKPLKRQDKIELSKVDHGKLMAQALIDGMIQNPDTILSSKGYGGFDVYKDLLRDDQVKSTFQQRRSAVISSEWYVDPASESSDDKAKADFLEWQLKQINFDEICRMMLYSTFYGFSVAEMILDYDDANGWIYIKDLKVRDRNRFKFDVNHNLVLHEGLDKKKMPMEKFWVMTYGNEHSDNPYGEGIAHSLYWPVFFKRNGIKFWMIYLEKYGMPTAVANLQKSQFMDPVQRQMALDVLEAIHADSGVAKPADFEIELLEAGRSGNATYDKLYDKMDAAISKIVLSQTMTTDNGSSRSQAEVHQGVRDGVVKEDADLLCQSFNEQVVKRIIDLNFGPGQDYPKVWRRTEPEADLNAMAERDTKICGMGYEPTEKYILETYGDGFVKKQEPEPQPHQQGDPGKEENNTEFAEPGKRARKSQQHREDQQSIVNGATMLATQYNALLMPQVERILAYAEETGDLETLRDNLYKLADTTNDNAVKNIERASLVARLAGLFKGQ